MTFTDLPTRNEGMDKPVLLKLFNAGHTWHIMDAFCVRPDGSECSIAKAAKARREVDDVIMFGHANLGDPQCAELGNVSLAEILGAPPHRPLPVLWALQRDCFYTPQTLQEVVDACRASMFV